MTRHLEAVPDGAPARSWLQAFIPGEVKGQGSMTLWRAPDGTERAKHPPATVEWRNRLAYELRRDWGGAEPIAEAVEVRLGAYFARPKGHYGTGRNAGELRPSAPAWKATYPDLDKIARAALDALTIAGVLADDVLVAALKASKHYASKQNPAGLFVAVERL
jgi:Holliday junction resolvase RusA-like endonuclease